MTGAVRIDCQPDRLSLFSDRRRRVGRAARKLTGGVDDDLRMISLDVVAAIGHADVFRPGKVGRDLVLHIRR